MGQDVITLFWSPGGSARETVREGTNSAGVSRGDNTRRPDHSEYVWERALSDIDGTLVGAGGSPFGGAAFALAVCCAACS